MAAGHRLRRREASLAVASAVPILKEVGLLIANCVSAWVFRSNLSSTGRWPAEVMVLSEIDARSPHHGFRGQ
jgi:hypothetical protein